MRYVFEPKGRAPLDLERIRARADSLCEDADAELDYYAAAIDLGYSETDAERADSVLIVRTMRARGAI